ncbi:MAG: PTS sugar transporter subunit IIB [Deltaproteobacteria bacterium]|nr:PTS sugar transporter subunit IIB [Deltaproteobacteria bacterium]
MDVTFVRVDNRLIHGQILEAWVPFIGASRIIVVNDEVASDIFRETVVRMAVPHDIEVLIYGVGEFSENYVIGENNKKRTIILFSDIDDSLKAYKTGFHFSKLNIGNVHCSEDTICCATSIFLSKDDIMNIMSLIELGVKVELRSVPRDKSRDFLDVMKGITF